MNFELHICLHEASVVPIDEILEHFPFEKGQTIISYKPGLIMIDLAEADDTTYVQDWYLNSQDDVLSFFVVED